MGSGLVKEEAEGGPVRLGRGPEVGRTQLEIEK